MSLSKDFISTAANVVAVLVALGGIIWFAATLNARVDRLEEQVHLLTVAPTIAKSATGQGGAVSNPMSQACADLAKKATEAADTGGSVGAQLEAEKMLDQLGCSRKPSGLPNSN